MLTETLFAFLLTASLLLLVLGLERERAWPRRAHLLRHPAGAFKSWARGEGKLPAGPAKTETATLLTGREQVRGSWLHALIGLNAAITIAVLALAAAGVVSARSLGLWILIGAALYLVVISGGPEAYSRFRVPVTPVLAVLAAAGVRAIRARVR